MKKKPRRKRKTKRSIKGVPMSVWLQGDGGTGFDLTHLKAVIEKENNG